MGLRKINNKEIKKLKKEIDHMFIDKLLEKQTRCSRQFYIVGCKREIKKKS